MLELAQVRKQMNAMLDEQLDLVDDYNQRLQTARTELAQWQGQWDKLVAKIAASRTSWLVAQIDGPPKDTFTVGQAPRPLSVVSTDGSQIFPDRHEVAGCYLLNIGRVAIHYGTKERPHLSSSPLLCYKDEDLYTTWGNKKTTITPELIGIRRGALEMVELVTLTVESASVPLARPVVALADGTMILWTLAGKPDDYRNAMLAEYLTSLQRFKEMKVPVAGYISDPRSADIVNALRVGLCPMDAVDCDRCPYTESCQEQLPCEQVAGITDAVLMAQVLAPGQRSRSFGSSSSILDEYGEEHRILFCYINVGAEIARLEFPAWVVEQGLLDLLGATVMDQVQKGNGYPVVLTEAHERAVVRGPERESFYRLLEETMVRRGIKAAVSRKSLGKRSVFV